jgi:hypothetical protein
MGQFRTLLKIIRAAWLTGGNSGPTPLPFVLKWRQTHPSYPDWCSLWTCFTSGSTMPIRPQSPVPLKPTDVWAGLGNTDPMPAEFPAQLEETIEACKSPETRARQQRAREDMARFRAEQLARKRACGENAFGLDPNYDPRT